MITSDSLRRAQQLLTWCQHRHWDVYVIDNGPVIGHRAVGTTVLATRVWATVWCRSRLVMRITVETTPEG